LIFATGSTGNPECKGFSMSFICPQCSAASLNITSCLELEGDNRSDDITLQLIACAACDFRGVAVYEESRRGALDSECADHYGYQVSEAAVQSLKILIEACPNSSNITCSCLAHRTLNRRDESGRWNALEAFEKSAYFPMQLA
jgi:hypothetical protein